jgi:16S rRNA (uracil1498-N3)-methyltransferase
VTLHRFFLPADAIDTGTVRFPPEAARQIARVLRLQPGDRVIVLDGTGSESVVFLESVGRETWGSVELTGPNVAEPAVEVTLFQGLLKGSKFEMVLQKCTEIGVSRFVPVQTAHAVPTEVAASRQGRFDTIVREAAEQCRRGKIPAVERPIPWRSAVERASAGGPAYVLWEEDRRSGLERIDLDPAVRQVSLFVGPEGGLSPDEVELAVASGARVVDLGPRILRAETAAMVGSALLLARLGEL